MNTSDTYLNSILIVDDMKTNLKFIESKLLKGGYSHTIACQDSRQVHDIISNRSIGIVLLDLKMPHISGEVLLAMINKEYPDIPVIIISGVREVDTAVTCMKMGAFDYITKPIDDDLLLSAVNRAMAFRVLKQENLELQKYVPIQQRLNNPEIFENIITHSPKMISIFKSIESIGPSPQPVLITGETGAGKEMIAQAIHKASNRTGQLITVNIAGLEDNIITDTLFGHIKGAFTGADLHRSGLVEKAKAGTLFLDEIGDLNPSSQVKLLRLLQEGEYLPIGADQVKKSDARIIVATNQDIWHLQQNGQFRKDLIYRLRTHHIHLPPLRERLEDIPLLVNHFLNLACVANKKERPELPKALFPLLGTYTFPGNIRELKSMVYDAVSRNTSDYLSLDLFKACFLPEHFKEIDVENIQNEKLLPDTKTIDGDQIFFPQTLPTIKDATQALVDEAMNRAKNVQTHAAKLLGISQAALNKRLKKNRENE